MRYGAEGGQRAAAWLDADSSVLRQIIIDKYPAAGQYVRLLLENNTTVVSVCRPHDAIAEQNCFVANRTNKNYWHSKTKSKELLKTCVVECYEKNKLIWL